MVFADLDVAFLPQCSSNECAVTDLSVCPLLPSAAADAADSPNTCFDACASTPGCTEVDFTDDGGNPPKCVLHACTIYPPPTVPAPFTHVWSYTGSGLLVKLTSGTGAWSYTEITATDCPAGPPNLIPRDSGYTMGVVKVASRDRLLILGGDAGENNVYYSDNCGATWQCFDGDQVWSPRDFAPLLHPLGIFPGDPVWMMGGDVDENDDEKVPSIGMFVNTADGLANWVRPTCTNPGSCAFECETGYLCLPGFPTYAGQVV